MEYGKKRENGVFSKGLGALLGVAAITLLFFSNTTVTLAANLGQQASTYVTQQIFWAGVIVLAIVLCGMLLKRSWIQALMTGIIGGVILIFIKDPSRLESFGNAIINAMNLGI